MPKSQKKLNRRSKRIRSKKRIAKGGMNTAKDYITMMNQADLLAKRFQETLDEALQKTSKIFEPKQLEKKKNGEYTLKNISLNLKKDYSKIVLTQEVGSGAFGSVWKGNLVDNGNNYAVKLLDIDTKNKSQIEEKEKFKQEAKMLALLLNNNNNNNNIVKFIDFVENLGEQMLITDYYSGGDLKGYINNPINKINKNNAKTYENIVDGIKNGLDKIIKQGIIHRDIAARNIFLDGEQRPYIGDFGLAISPNLKKLNNNEYIQPEDNELLPVNWCAPETASKGFSIKSDIYSFGCILYEIVTGGQPPVPFNHPNRSEIMKNEVEKYFDIDNNPFKDITDTTDTTDRKMPVNIGVKEISDVITTEAQEVIDNSDAIFINNAAAIFTNYRKQSETSDNSSPSYRLFINNEASQSLYEPIELTSRSTDTVASYRTIEIAKANYGPRSSISSVMYKTIQEQNKLEVEEYSVLVFEDDSEVVVPLSPNGTIDFVNEIKRIDLPSSVQINNIKNIKSLNESLKSVASLESLESLEPLNSFVVTYEKFIKPFDIIKSKTLKNITFLKKIENNSQS